MTQEPAAVSVLVDNDVLLKIVSYRLADLIWPDELLASGVGVLGAARFVVGRLLSQRSQEARAQLDATLVSLVRLEPTPAEVELASSIEVTALKLGAQLDSGESLLVAIMVVRGLARLQTGDKRAIAALESLLDWQPRLTSIQGRVECLEQLVLRNTDDRSFGRMSSAVCGDPMVDKTLAICFSCRSRTRDRDGVMAALESYIRSLRGQAPRILCD